MFTVVKVIELKNKNKTLIAPGAHRARSKETSRTCSKSTNN
jgi:hypothetical protein